jgi:hypothetical protein
MSEPAFKLSRVSGAPVSDEELIEDLRRVAELLGTERVSFSQYDHHGEYCAVTQAERFGSWNNAILRAGLTIYAPYGLGKTRLSDEELIADLRRVAELLATENVTINQYDQYGKYNHVTQHRRFGTWNDAILRAGLTISNRVIFSDVKLFENILTLWQHYGRQPSTRELASAPSFISTERPYRRRFGSWMNALRAFVDYANGTGADATESKIEEATETPITKAPENPIDETTESLIAETTERQLEAVIVRRHTTGHNPSLRLRWCVLQRDNFKCCGCGASPAITLGVELHVDHIHPWSDWGETVLENLQTLCSKCNLGKSNLLP